MAEHSARKPKFWSVATSSVCLRGAPKAWSALLAVTFLVTVLISSVGAWVTLTQDGYAFEHKLLAQAGVRISEDLKIAGLAVSSPEAQLRCNPSRRGALRWSEDNSDLEACDGESDWRPLLFCDTDCAMSLHTVPCGVPVRNMCDRLCERVGQGLNMRHCILNVAQTPCGEEVVDGCNNVCGLQGQQGCDAGDDATTVGSMEIKSLAATGGPAAAYRLSVGRLSGEGGDGDGEEGALDNALYLDILRNPNPAGLTEVESEEERDTVLKMSYIAQPEGLEIETPTEDPYTVRVSMFSELTGGYVKLGDSSRDASTSTISQYTHIYLDGVVENAHRGWMPKFQGSRDRAHDAERQLVTSTRNYQAQIEQGYNLSQVRDAARAEGREETVEMVEGMLPTVTRTWMPDEDAEDPHKAVANGFRLDEDLESESAWGFRDCPFLFSAGAPKDHSDLGAGNFVRVCLDKPSRQQKITLPDPKPDPLTAPMRQVQFGTSFEAELATRHANAPWSSVHSFGAQPWHDALSGMIVTSGNAHDLAGLPGLTELETLAFRGGRAEEPDQARVQCCTRTQNQTLECAFNCQQYNHSWGFNGSDTFNGSVTGSVDRDLRAAASTPWWFFAERLRMSGSVNSSHPLDGANETVTAPNDIDDYLACALGGGGCEEWFVARPELSFTTQGELRGGGLNLSLNGSGNGSGWWEPGAGCGLYNFSSLYFDLFRIHYQVHGWTDILLHTASQVVQRYTIYYPVYSIGNVSNCTNQSVQTYWPDGSVTESVEVRCENTTVVSEESYVASPFGERAERSLAAALHVQKLLGWKEYWEAEQTEGRFDRGRLVKLHNLRYAKHLEGYYEKTGELSYGRPVLRQQGGDNVIFCTQEWYSTDPVWAVGPSTDLSFARLRVQSGASQPAEIRHAWSEWSDHFPVAFRINPDARVVTVSMNVTTEEFEEAWGDMWGFEDFASRGLGEPSDAERCFVCCCRSHNETGNRTWAPESVCNAAPEYELPSLRDQELRCHRTDLGTVCVNVSVAPNASVVVEFETPQSDRFLQFPAASGTILSSGNLRDITSLGIQGAPVLGYSSLSFGEAGTVVHLHFGGDEEDKWPLSAESCAAANCSAETATHVNKPGELLGCFCGAGTERLESELWRSLEERADLEKRQGPKAASGIGNNLQLPSRADGILLSTGNLEDVTASSGAMTGLQISSDVSVNGFLQFGSGAHAGECNWTACNERDHVTTSGLVLTPTERQRGWGRREKAWCGNIGADALHGFEPDEEGGPDEVCGETGSGRHCFQFVNGSLDDCMSECVARPCSVLLASRFNLVELWWNASDSLFVSPDGTLDLIPVPTDASEASAWEMMRFNCSNASAEGRNRHETLSRDSPILLPGRAGEGGAELSECLVWLRTRTLASTRPAPLPALYLAGGEDRSAAAQLSDLETQRALLLSDVQYMRLIRSCVSNTFCAAGISWPGGEESQLAMDSGPALCDGTQTEFTYAGVLFSCNASEAYLAASGLENRYTAQLAAVAAVNAEVVRVSELIAAAPSALDAVPHLWRMRAATPNVTEYNRSLAGLKHYSLHHEGFCMEVAEGEAEELSCGVGGTIEEVVSGFFGEVKGECGEYELAGCGADVSRQLAACEGNATCFVNATRLLWLTEEESVACGERPLRFRAYARCRETPLLLFERSEPESGDPIFMIQQSSGEIGDSIPYEGIFQIGFEERIECITDRALPARIQATTCGAVSRDGGDVYLFEGLEGNLSLLLQSDGRDPPPISSEGNGTQAEEEVSDPFPIGNGPKTMLRVEGKETSNSAENATEVLFPATNGRVLSTGNLEDLTAESGAISSLHVRQRSFFHDGITLGAQKPLTEHAPELHASVHASWWEDSELGSRAEGGSRYLWDEGPWLTLFGVGDCSEDVTQFGIACNETVVTYTVTIHENVTVTEPGPNGTAVERVEVQEREEERQRVEVSCPVWADPDGYGCETYGREGWCGRAENANLTMGGVGADEVCCACRESQVDTSIKYNSSDGGVTRLLFKAHTDGVAQIEFPVAWGVNQGKTVPHGYSDVTGGVYSLHLCSDPAGSAECEARVVTTGNLDDVRNLSARTVNVTGPTRLEGPVILGSGAFLTPFNTPTRSPPGAFGQAEGSLWTTFDAEWRANTRTTVTEHNDMKNIALRGVIMGGLTFRNVPRDRSRDGIHAHETPQGVRYIPFEWHHVSGRVCEALQHVEVPGQPGVVKSARYDHSQRRKGMPREAVTNTLALSRVEVSTCQERCALNGRCGVVWYRPLGEQSEEGAELVDCTLVYIPASACTLVSGPAWSGLWLYPRNESLEVQVAAGAGPHTIAFPGARSGVVITSDNPTDIPHLRGLRNTGNNDPWVHTQAWEEACRGLSEDIPECGLQFRSAFHRCMLARFPSWGGFGVFEDGTCDLPEYEAQLSGIEQWRTDPASMPHWTQGELTPQMAVDFVVAGERCRGEFQGFDLVRVFPEARALLEGAGYQPSDQCSVDTCPTCQGYLPDGALPDYVDGQTGERPHVVPSDPVNRRITFPDASGTVITSGNTDDVVFKSMRLEGLELDGYAYFGQVDENLDFRFDSDEPVRVRFAETGHALRFTGPLNILGGTNFETPAAGEAYGAPGDIPPKPSGRLAGLVSQRTEKPFQVCLPADCPWPTVGQGDCPRIGFEEGERRTRESDCETVGEECRGAGTECRESFLCQGGEWSGEPCSINAHCCERSATGVLRNDCVHKCVGQREYLARPERGGFHTLTYQKRPALLEEHCSPGQSCTAGQPSDDFWVGEKELFQGLYYTQLVYEDPTANNTIVLPDVSGTILTTGNLIDLPAMDLAQGTLFVGGHTGVRGDLMLGGPDAKEPIQIHSWIDGDAGVTFRTSGGCTTVRVEGVQRYHRVLGDYYIQPRRFESKPVWKHASESLYLFFHNNVALGADGLTQGEGRWYIGSEVGAREGEGENTPLQLRMKRLSWSPVDPDVPFPREKEGAWEEWGVSDAGDGQWFLEKNISVTCAVPKETLHHIRVSVSKRPGQDEAVRQYLRGGARALPIPVLQRVDDAETVVELYSNPLPGSTELNVAECARIMLAEGEPGSYFCPSEDNCVETFDTRPTSIGSYARYLDAKGLLKPTILNGPELRPFSGVTRRWTGCVLDGTWDLSPVVKMQLKRDRGELEWGQTVLEGLSFGVEGSRLVSEGSWHNGAGASGRVRVEVAGNCTQMALAFTPLDPPPPAVFEDRVFTLRRCDADFASPRCFGDAAGADDVAPPSVRERIVYDASGSVQTGQVPLHIADATAWLSARDDVSAPTDVFARAHGQRADLVAKGGLLVLVGPGECSNASELWPRCLEAAQHPDLHPVFSVDPLHEVTPLDQVAPPDWAGWITAAAENVTVAGIRASQHCTVGVRLPGNGSEVTALRFGPRKGGEWLLVGGVFQAGSGLDDNSVVDLHVIRGAPREGELTLARKLPAASRGLQARWVWFVGEREGACDALGKLEVHIGELSRTFVPAAPGTDSYFVDDGSVRLREQVGAAMVSKCAGMGWFPAHQRGDVEELAMPGASGTLLSTGSLGDISIGAGPLTGLSVGGRTEVRGDLELGAAGADSIAAVDAHFSGAQPLSFGRVPRRDHGEGTVPTEGCEGSESVGRGGGGREGSSSLRLGAPSGSNFLVMSGSTGTILTRGLAHYALDGEGSDVLMGRASVTGALHVEGDSEIGGARASQGRREYEGWEGGREGAGTRTRIASEIMGDFPMTFTGKFKATDVDKGTSLAVSEGEGERKLLLPDASGTAITTASFPPMVQDMTGAGVQQFGRVTFEGAGGREEGGNGTVTDSLGHTIVFGGGETALDLEINAVVKIVGGLAFEGELQDGQRTTLEVEEPSAAHVLTLPDADGMVVTSNSLPESLPDLRVLGPLSLYSHVTLAAHPGDSVHVGAAGTIMQHATVTGRFPLQFSATAAGGNGTGAASTTFEMMGGSGSNVAAFGDGSGTVITTGNLEAYCKVAFTPEYALEAASVSLVAAEGFAVGAGAETVVAGTRADGGEAAGDKDLHGAFVYTDSDDNATANLKVGPNQFVVQARGGVRMVSGVVGGGARDAGVQLAARGSGWSVLSDEESKEAMHELDGKATLQTLAEGVPVSYWRYEGRGERHLGPMAQDLHEAFGLGEHPDRISTIDADGIALAAAKGMWQHTAELEQEVQDLELYLAQLTGRNERNRAMVSSNAAAIERIEGMLRLLEGRGAAA